MQTEDRMSEERGTGRLNRRDFMIAGGAVVVGAGGFLAGAEPALAGGQTAISNSAPPVLHSMQLQINGELHAIDIDLGDTLLDALRERVGLSGTKRGCDMGACGACTVLVDGRRVNACLMLAPMAEGSAITTIEGIAPNESLHPIQQAFVDHDGLQCGYCTPGQIISAIAYVSEGHADVSNPAVIREWMSGNLCRCGAYSNIVAAVAAVAAQLPRTPADAR